MALCPRSPEGLNTPGAGGKVSLKPPVDATQWSVPPTTKNPATGSPVPGPHPTDPSQVTARIQAPHQMKAPVIALPPPPAREDGNERISSFVAKGLRAASLQPSIADTGAAGLEMDCRGRRTRLGGREVDLPGREFALAQTFLRHAGQVLSREQLLSRVWGGDFDPGSNTVDVDVRYLRHKLGADRCETVRGMGYRMVDQGRPAGDGRRRREGPPA